MTSGTKEQQPVPAAADDEEDFTDMDTKCHDLKDMITEVALKSDADDNDEDNDCKILQSILNNGHYNISQEDRTALESVITDTSGKEEDMDQ